MAAIKRFPLELICWLSALAMLAFFKIETSHFSLCPLANLGVIWCPGCGLGHSISSLLHVDLKSSIAYHWFGIPATAILLHRIFVLAKNFSRSFIHSYKPLNYEP